MSSYAWPSEGGGGGVTSLNTLTGDITLAAGTGLTLSTLGQTITISSTVGYGNLTDAGTDGITITGGTGAVVGSGTSIAQHVADTSHNGYLSSTDWNTFNGKQATGNYATSGSGDVSWSAPSGAGPVTTALVATSNSTLATLSALTSASLLATVGTIGTGVWQATAVGATYGGTGISTAASTGYPSIAAGTWSVASATSTFATLFETVATSAGDLIRGGTSGAPTRLAIGSTGNVLTVSGGEPVWAAPATNGTVTSVTFTGDGTVLSSTPSSAVTTTGTLTASLATQTARTFLQGPQSGSAAAPTFAALKAPTINGGGGIILSTGTQTGWLFTVTGWTGTIVAGDTYTNNGHTYTAQQTTQTNGGSGQTLFMSGTGATSGSTLTKSSSASGPATITFSATTATATYTTPSSPSPLYLRIKMLGGGGGGAGSGTGSNGAATSGLSSFFGTNLLVAAGGNLGVFGGNGGTGGAPTINSGAIDFGSITGGQGQGASDSGTSVGTEPGIVGGNGGNSAIGGGGPGSAYTSSGIGAVANSGGGGGGAGAGNATAGNLTGTGGGAGAYVDAVITSIATSYPYCIGAGGVGGAAGTGGASGGGGAGAAGRLVVEEVYQ